MNRLKCILSKILILILSWYMLSFTSVLPKYMIAPGCSYIKNLHLVRNAIHNFPKNTYNQLIEENADMTAGSSANSYNGKLYVTYENKIYIFNFEKNEYNDFSSTVYENCVYFDGMCIGIADTYYQVYSDNKITGKIPNNWREKYINKNGIPEFSAIYKLLKYQDDNEINLSEYVNLVSLIKNNIVLKWDGECAYISQRQEDGTRLIYKCVGEGKNDTTLAGECKAFRNILYLDDSCYFIGEDRRTVYVINFKEDDILNIEEIYKLPDTYSGIKAMNVSDSTMGKYFCLLTENNVIVRKPDSNFEYITDIDDSIEGGEIYCLDTYIYVYNKDKLNSKKISLPKEGI